MNRANIYRQTDPQELAELIRSSPMCHLITHIDQKLQCGVFNPILHEEKIYLHLNRNDPQFHAVRESSHAHLLFFDFLCHIPSYWIDKDDAGVATSYYRHLELACKAKVSLDEASIAAVCQKLMTHYQPEGGYAPLSDFHEAYLESYKILGIIELTPLEIRAKWKLGQNRPLEVRESIVEKLKQRNHGNDQRTITEINKWIHQS